MSVLVYDMPRIVTSAQDLILHLFVNGNGSETAMKSLGDFKENRTLDASHFKTRSCDGGLWQLQYLQLRWGMGQPQVPATTMGVGAAPSTGRCDGGLGQPQVSTVDRSEGSSTLISEVQAERVRGQGSEIRARAGWGRPTSMPLNPLVLA